MAKLKLGVVGGSGYGGAELIRTLLSHPQAEICWASAGERAGCRVDRVYPNLRGLTDLVFEDGSAWERLPAVDCLFLALPHGQSQRIAGGVSESVALIDLSGDFRLSDAAEFERFYGSPHEALHLQGQFVYGLTEVNRERIRQAKRIANPGCFATAALLGIYPLAAAGALSGTIVVDAKTGSSGSGSKAAENTHHPTRANSFYAYKPFSHQHLPEIRQALREAVPGWDGGVILQTHSAPMVRGIFASVYCQLRRPMDSGQVRALYESCYAGSFFVRLVESSPNVNWVKNSNFADIGWALQGRDLVVFVAIDNLVKGAAGQAIQNMNLMHGLPEETGLAFPGSCP